MQGRFWPEKVTFLSVECLYREKRGTKMRGLDFAYPLLEVWGKRKRFRTKGFRSIWTVASHKSLRVFGRSGGPSLHYIALINVKSKLIIRFESNGEGSNRLSFNRNRDGVMKSSKRHSVLSTNVHRSWKCLVS